MATDRAVAIANDGVVLIAWRYGAKIDGCLGFAIERKAGTPDTEGAWLPLTGRVGFPGQSGPAWGSQPTTVWPVQKFEWIDRTAPAGGTYSYRITPLSGQQTDDRPLQRDAGRALITNVVTLTPLRGSFATGLYGDFLSPPPLPNQTEPNLNELSLLDPAAVLDLMDTAKQAILFLDSQPGSVSVGAHAAQLANRNPGMFVRGVTTDRDVAGTFNATLLHRAGEDPVTVPAIASSGQLTPGWREMRPSMQPPHAIRPGTVVVIDPLSEDGVVITGSQEHGYRAARNDTGLLILGNYQPLAQSYAVHALDVYDHHRFGYVMQQGGAGAGLDPTDGWQDKYFDPRHPASHDAFIWTALPGNPTRPEDPPEPKRPDPAPSPGGPDPVWPGRVTRS